MAEAAPEKTVESPTSPVDAAQMASSALDAAQSAVNQLAQGDTGPSSGPNVSMPNFQQVLAEVEAGGIDLLHDVDLNVKIELGRTHMLVEEVLKLAEGSVVELDKLAGDPVDVFVNDRLVARGEVLVLNDNFCVRISEVIAELDQAADQSASANDSSAGASGKPG